MTFLGIDTSNYTTSLAASENGKITANIKKLLNVKEGERGLRQSDALFAHTVCLPEIFAGLGKTLPTAVGVSDRPRNVEGSYMPCFLAGVSAASAIAETCGIPLFRFSHQEGHIAAALYSCEREDLHHGEMLALHLSGGTTELLHVKNGKIDLIGGTLDISCGKVIDRIGVANGLHFPCGAEMEKAAEGFDFPKVRVSVRDGLANLSGAENLAENMRNEGRENGEIFAFAFSYITETISEMIEYGLAAYPKCEVLLSGGVASNEKIKKILHGRFGCLFAEPQFSSDNAAGIARLAEMKYNGEI